MVQTFSQARKHTTYTVSTLSEEAAHPTVYYHLSQLSVQLSEVIKFREDLCFMFISCTISEAIGSLGCNKQKKMRTPLLQRVAAGDKKKSYMLSSKL